jgi:hypothetical protein
MPEVAADPIAPGTDMSRAPMDAGLPDTAKPGPSAASAKAKDGPAPIPTGFPETVQPDAPRTAADGKVILAPVPPLGSVTLPPLEEGGKSFVIEAVGTEVDEETAERAHAAASAAGFRLREL